MRYTILRPHEPFDPRRLSYASLDELRLVMPSISDCDLEVQAMMEVRKLYPDAVVMPVPLKVGVGEVFLLGVLPDIGAPHNPEGKIPFVLFVQATSQNGGDTNLMKKRGQWNRRLWKTPILKPTHPAATDAEELDVELRASDLEQPAKLVAQVFSRSDRHGFTHRVIYLEIGGVEMSLEFSEPTTKVHVGRCE